MHYDLEGKVIVVTGAGGGIGISSCKIMAGSGAKIAALDLTEESTLSLVKEINANGGEAISVACDISDEAAVKTAVDTVVKRFGRIDVLFNNAGIVGDAKHILEMTKADLVNVLNVNVVGTYVMSVAAAKIMKEQGKGRIISVSSMSGIQADYGASAYDMTKAAISMMNQCLALELSEFGISSVVVSPGMVKTPMLTKAFDERAASEGMTTEDYMDKMSSIIPAGRYAEPEDIAHAAAFLASDVSHYISGTQVISAGGYILR